MVRGGADKAGHLGPLCLHHLFDFNSQVIHRGGVAETLLEIREHGCQNFGPDRGGRGMV
jgi:hypothetical protein